MSHPLAEQLIEMLEDATKMDFAAAPAIQFMSLLRDKLVFKGFSEQDAETLVSSIEVEMPQGALTPEQMLTVTAHYATIIEKARDALVDSGFKYPMASLLQLAKTFTLNLS